MDVEQARALAAVICRAIDYFHASKMAHGAIGSTQDDQLASFCEECEDELEVALVGLPD